MLLGSTALGSIELGGVRAGTGGAIIPSPGNEVFFDATIKQVKMPTAVIFNITPANLTTQTASLPMNN